MLTYEQALHRILDAAPSPRSVFRTLGEAVGLALVRPVVARCDLPLFDHAAVDGYALSIAKDDEPTDGSASQSFRVIGRSEAGRPFRGLLHPGTCVRILTGARIPRGATTVVMQEQTTLLGDRVSLTHLPPEGAHIRRQGEDVHRGQTVLSAGTILRPQEVALLASLGYRRIAVCRPPRVAILSTGDELRPPGSRLRGGQIYDSNSVLLMGLVRHLQAVAVPLGMAVDDPAAVEKNVQEALACDLVVISGGVSVGEKDVVRVAAAQCGVRTILWRVDIKPGMPLFVGRRRRTLVFGLPGNPVSVFVTFEEFVKPVICRLMGRPWRDGYTTRARLAQDLRVSTTRRTHFLRVRRISANGEALVELVPGQGSHQVSSLVNADGWIRMAAGEGPWSAGTPVSVKWA